IWRLKGSSRLGRGALTVLREIWNWREHEATAANKPPYFVMRHETLIELASAAAGGRPVERLIPQKFSDRRKAGLLQAIKHALSTPAREQPEPLQHLVRRLSDHDKKRISE